MGEGRALDLDPGVLAALLLLQTISHVAEPREVPRLFARGVERVPGVAAAFVCGDTGAEQVDVRIPLATASRRFGDIGVRLSDAAVFQRYEPFVRNVAITLALRLERGYLLDRLDALVRERTAELEAANAALAQRARELEVVTADLSRIGYAVSHELRAPLRASAGFAGVLEEELGPSLSPRHRGYLARLQQASRRMSCLLDDLLRMIRVVGAPLRPVDLDLGPIARSIVEDLRAGDPGRAVDLVIAGPVPVHGDPHLLGILLTCLLDNAWKFTRPRPSARIEVAAEASGFRVQDDGVGFDPAHGARIFEPFWRAHGPEEHPGAGIGLAVAMRIAARHGGRIWGESAPDQGATFHVELPSPAGGRAPHDGPR